MFNIKSKTQLVKNQVFTVSGAKIKVLHVYYSAASNLFFAQVKVIR